MNNIGDEGAKKISELLMNNSSLTQLNVRSYLRIIVIIKKENDAIKNCYYKATVSEQEEKTR